MRPPPLFCPKALHNKSHTAAATIGAVVWFHFEDKSPILVSYFFRTLTSVKFTQLIQLTQLTDKILWWKKNLKFIAFCQLIEQTLLIINYSIVTSIKFTQSIQLTQLFKTFKKLCTSTIMEVHNFLSFNWVSFIEVKALRYYRLYMSSRMESC